MNDFFNVLKTIVDELYKIIISEPFITVLTGTGVFILSTWIMEFKVNPKKELKALKQKILYTINMYCCYYNNPYNPFNEKSNVRAKEEYDLASIKMRKIGSELAGYIGTMPSNQKKEKQKLNTILNSLIGLSKGFYILSEDFNWVEENMKLDKIIRDELEIK